MGRAISGMSEGSVAVRERSGVSCGEGGGISVRVRERHGEGGRS